MDICLSNHNLKHLSVAALLDFINTFGYHALNPSGMHNVLLNFVGLTIIL